MGDTVPSHPALAECASGFSPRDTNKHLTYPFTREKEGVERERDREREGGARERDREKGGLTDKQRQVTNNNNNILYPSQREIKAVVRSHNEEHISIILSH